MNGSSAGPTRIQEARRMVSGPATALVVIGVLGALVGIIAIVVNERLLDSLNDVFQSDELKRQIQEIARNQGLNFSLNGLFIALSVLMAIGGMRMRALKSYRLSWAGAIVACLPCVGSCGCVGLPFGIWALVTLAKVEVKEGFAQNR
jgi:uncharacterized BrkB/YihY/UPF0761 family membrane protein